MVLAFVLLITVPFAGQAFHIDDAIFWDFAKLNLDSPLRQDIPDYHLMGFDVPQFRDTHPPLDQAYMSAIMRATGSDNEVPLHLGFIIFPAIAGVSMYFLARRFTGRALLATLLLLATPAFMAASHTLMGDVPMTSFWLAATAFYIFGVDRDDARLLALAGISAALAVMAGYQALALLLLLPAYALLKGKVGWRTLWPLALPALIFGAYALFSLIKYGALPRFQHAKGLSLQGSNVLGRIEGNFLQLGGATVFPLVMAGAYCLHRRRWLMLVPIAAVSLGLALYYSSSNPFFPTATAVLFVIFLTAAVLMVASISGDSAVQLVNAVRRRHVDIDFIYLAFWLLVMMSAVALVLPHTTSKYMLPFLAPAVLLLFRELEKGLRSGAAITAIAVAAVALTFVAGTSVASADYQLAQTYKDYSLDFASRYAPEGQVWFVGEWGFRHYMESQGYRYLTTASTEPREGDLVVKTSLMGWPLDSSVERRLHLVDSLAWQQSSPLQVMSITANAGFYGTFWGKLPYTFTREPVEIFDVYSVGPAGGAVN